MKKPIYLIDLTHETKLGLGSDMMPLQLGLIGAHCVKEHGDKIDVQIFKFVKEFSGVAEKIPPFILGASSYLWNLDLEYKYASAIKEKYPETIVIFGGPNYPDDPAEQIKWLKKYPNVDFFVYKDGEVPFARLAGELLNNPDVNAVKRLKLPSVHSLIDGEPYFGELEPRLTDLTVTPSPYTLGLMDKFFEEKLLPTIQTNRGCPFTCAYCTEGRPYYTQICRMSFERKKEEIDYIVNRVKHTKTLRITDSNFGMFEEDVEFCKYLGEVKKQTGYPEYLACSTGKNQKERILECNRLLGGIMRFCASVQSLNQDVLKNVKRMNISLDETMALSDQISDTDTHSYSEIILGLPGDSLAAEKESMEGLINAGISNITQHQLALIYGSELFSKESRETYGTKTMFRPIQRCVGSYSFGDKKFQAIEIEEVCTANNTMGFEDYLEARSLYLTVGLFYNDRIFGEIHAFLRLLHLSTWEWLMLVHENIKKSQSEVKNLYDGFVRDTKNELWESQEKLLADVGGNIEKFEEGEAGGNLIYKYRSQAIDAHFNELLSFAFENLRVYLVGKGMDYKAEIDELEKFAKYQKSDLFNFDFEKTEEFHYDIVKMIRSPQLARTGGTLKDLAYPVKINFSLTKEQKESIKRQLDFYGSDIGGLTMLISRFPLKRFYRTTEIINYNVPAACYGEDNMKILALIIARGGSKGVPRKNIKLLAGKPLLAYPIDEAKKSKYINRVILTTDDLEIAEIGRKYGAETPFLRPAELAQDATTELPVVQHTLNWLCEHENYVPDIVIRLVPTSPLITAEYIDKGIEMLLQNPDADSVRSVTESPKHPLKCWHLENGRLTPFIPKEIYGFDEPYIMPRQKLPKAFVNNGAVDVLRPSVILEKNSWLGSKIHGFEMPAKNSINIDTEDDFKEVEKILGRKMVLYSGPVESFEVVKKKLGDKFDLERTEPTSDDLLPKFEKCSVYLDASMKVRIPAENINEAENLKLIVTATTGADHIDSAALESRGIPLLTLKGQKDVLRNLTPAAEHSWLLLMACVRKLRGAIKNVEAGGWDRVQFPGTMLKGKTIGIIGMGRIGSWMARYAQAFDMQVQVFDPFIPEFPNGVKKVSLDEVLQTSDFISIHVNYTPEVKGLITSEMIKKMKPCAVFINTSRGELVDEKALVEELESGRISAVGADVISGETEINANPLWQYAQTHNNVIITPHIGGFCPESVDITVAFSCDRILNYFEENNLF